MMTWILCFFSLLLAIWILTEEYQGIIQFDNHQRQIAALGKVCSILHEIQETLEAGLVPAPGRWDEIRKLQAPWGVLAYESLQLLRSQGGAILPTLRRLRLLAQNHQASLKNARAKSAQALAQAMICAVLVPLFGGALYFLLPGVSERGGSWAIACSLALLASGAGALWLLRLSEVARWGGLKASQRSWMLAAQCAGERFLALIRAGVPGDLSWTQAWELLRSEAPELSVHWGASVWESHVNAPASSGAASALIAAGSSLRKSVQVSLMEGRPCSEKVETSLLALRQDVEAHVERQLGLLSTQALKPLFFCVAPALMGLLVFGLFLGWQQAAGGMGG